MGLVNPRANYRGIGQLLKGAVGEAAVRPTIDRIRDTAEAIAPVGKPPDDMNPGVFKASFVAQTFERGDRVIGEVITTDPHGVDKELGHVAARAGIGPGRWVEGAHTLLKALTS